jgi:protoheme IX farnesyltransferase
VLLLPIALAPTLLGIAGWLYGAAAMVMGLAFVGAAVAVWRDETDRAPKRMFAFSIFYLFVLFALMIADRTAGFGG